MKNKVYETKMEGFAICLVNHKTRGKIIVRTFIEVEAIYHEDWDFDLNHGWYDLGYFDYDIKEAKIVDDEDYEIVTTFGFKECNGKIELLEVLDYDLDEVEI